jgi:hypothetical protein
LDDPVPVAWAETDEGGNLTGVVAFRPRSFYQWAMRVGYELPGGERATKQLLMDRYGWVTRDKADWMPLGGLGRPKRVNAVRLVGVLDAEIEAERVAQKAAFDRAMGGVGESGQDDGFDM